MKKTTTNTTANATVDNATVNTPKQEIVSFEVVAMNGKTKDLTFYNASLIEHTKKIQFCRDAGNMAILAIAHEFDEMDKDESYKSAGFKTVADYGRIVFDYKPATVSLYLRSARAFITTGENGEPTYRQNLPKLTVGQMIELLPLVKNEDDITEVVKGFAEGELNQQMSTKAMRDAVSGMRAIDGKVKEVEKKEKSAIEKAEKLGEYNADKLPKNTTPTDYAITNVEAAMLAMENVGKSIADIETAETVNAKIANIMTALTELRAELSK